MPDNNSLYPASGRAPAISDTRTGLSFAIFYLVCCIPMRRIADSFPPAKRATAIFGDDMAIRYSLFIVATATASRKLIQQRLSGKAGRAFLTVLKQELHHD